MANRKRLIRSLCPSRGGSARCWNRMPLPPLLQLGSHCPAHCALALVLPRATQKRPLGMCPLPRLRSRERCSRCLDLSRHPQPPLLAQLLLVSRLQLRTPGPSALKRAEMAAVAAADSGAAAAPLPSEVLPARCRLSRCPFAHLGSLCRRSRLRSLERAVCPCRALLCRRCS